MDGQKQFWCKTVSIFNSWQYLNCWKILNCTVYLSPCPEHKGVPLGESPGLNSTTSTPNRASSILIPSDKLNTPALVAVYRDKVGSGHSVQKLTMFTKRPLEDINWGANALLTDHTPYKLTSIWFRTCWLVWKIASANTNAAALFTTAHSTLSVLIKMSLISSYILRRKL